MTELRAGDVEGLLRRDNPGYPIFLVFGPDAGLVFERAQRLAHGGVDDPTDSFQLIRLDGDVVASDPMRLVDEANTRALFGGKRCLWIKPTNRNLVPAVEPLVATPSLDARVVIEAGDLAKSSPLRALGASARNIASIVCYADSERDVASLVDESLRSAQLSLEAEARELLLDLLGADRAATRNEIAKLVCYAGESKKLSADEVLAVVGDVSAVALDTAIDSAFTGDFASCDKALLKLLRESTDPGVILGAAQRHALLIIQIADRKARNPGYDFADDRQLRLHFRRKEALRRHMALWTAQMAGKAASDLQAAILDIRRHALTAEAVLRQSLWSLGAAARRSSRS
jgi:DNA polymerase-3 subunit delta